MSRGIRRLILPMLALVLASFVAGREPQHSAAVTPDEVGSPTTSEETASITAQQVADAIKRLQTATGN